MRVQGGGTYVTARGKEATYLGYFPWGGMESVRRNRQVPVARPQFTFGPVYVSDRRACTEGQQPVYMYTHPHVGAVSDDSFLSGCGVWRCIHGLTKASRLDPNKLHPTDSPEMPYGLEMPAHQQ